MKRIDELAQFMMERHRTYLARKAGNPWPWTTDSILQQYRFCNVYRELDTTTQWIDKHIRQPYAQHQYLWFMLVVARYINWPATLEWLINAKSLHAWPDRKEFHPEEIMFALEDRQKKYTKIYSSAYMITTHGKEAPTKAQYYCNHVFTPLWQERKTITKMLEAHTRLEGAFSVLNTYPGMGKFMTYEVITDMRHTRYLRNATDIYTWASAGPGAKRGLNRLHGRPLEQSINEYDACAEMMEILHTLNHPRSQLGRKMDRVFGPAIHPWFEMRDVEHSLCEFDKYERVRLGEGRPRSKYSPPNPTEKLL